MYIKRTLILSKIGLENKKALATIQNKGKCPLICARLQENASNIFAMVRFANSPIEVVPLNFSECDNCFNGTLPDFFDCSGEIFIMIVCISNGRLMPIYLGGGNERKNCFYDEVLKNLPFYYNKCMSLKGQSGNDCQNLKEDKVCNKDINNCSEIEENVLNRQNFTEHCENSVSNNQNEKNEESESCENNLNEINAKLFEPATESEIDESLTDSLLTECLMQKGKCENCVYKKAFYENDYIESDAMAGEECKEENQNEDYLQFYNNLKEENAKEVNALKDKIEATIKEEVEEKEEIEENLQNENKEEQKGDENSESNAELLQFYKQIEKSLNALFSAYPNDEVLEGKIENSKFAKVDYENTGDFYSVGYISENGMPKYICYAIPCQAGSPPPKNMEEFSQYLPIDNLSAYYLMYQKASNGETIQLSTSQQQSQN